MMYLSPSFFRTVSATLSLATLGIVCAKAEGDINFNKDIKPILSENCYYCHGYDKNKREAGLRLDTFAGATADNDGVRAIVPGDPEASEIFHRIHSTDPDEIMPPPKAKISLTSGEKALLKKWIEQGAEYAEHWAFVPPVKPAVDAEKGHPIDQFIAKGLAENNLQAAPEADRTTLIRRLSLDLTGLPPTTEEVAQFVSDASPDAYGKLVDRLLASPHYGERMAWDWLDAARYADSNGYQGDNERTMWPWRDWVIKAFNDNLPYDQFTVWQLAGDLLENATDEQILATGFCRNHPINGEGGRIPEENRVEYVMDMSETMGTVWLGLTLNCCRCHDHKFDPLSQANYFQFTAFFNQTPVDGGGGNAQQPPVLPVYADEDQFRISELETKAAETRAALSKRSKELAATQAEWESQQVRKSGKSAWQVLQPSLAIAEHQDIRILDDQSILTSGENPDNDSYEVKAPVRKQLISSIRLEALRHASMTKGGIARSDSGNFVLTNFTAHLDGKPLKIARAVASFEQGPHKITNALDDDPTSGWAVFKGRPVDEDHAAYFYLETPVEAGDTSELTFTFQNQSPFKNHNLGRFRLSVSCTANLSPSKSEDSNLLVSLLIPEEKRSKEQNEQILLAHRGSDPAHTALQKQLDGLKAELNKLNKSAAKVMVMRDRDKLRDTFVLEKGIYSQHKEKVSMGVPEALHKMTEEQPANRLGLAQWLVNPQNPLTARVTVNRFWQQLFGIGLVKTAEDFGTQGETPPQQELLDWLAINFIESGWDVKQLMRTMVMSATYRQTSKSTTYAADPENRWLARGPRFRMPSWMLRDHALTVSGLLVHDIGGEPVNPYQPAGIWEETSFGKKKYNQDNGDKLYRRSLYTFWRRIAAPTAFFDNSTRQVCSVKPYRTNTPLHALYTFNDVTFVEAARVLAQAALKQSDDQDRLAHIYKKVIARLPKPAEAAAFFEALESSMAHFTKNPNEATSFLAIGDSPRDEKLNSAEHAAWASLALAVLNLDETVTKE